MKLSGFLKANSIVYPISFCRQFETETSHLFNSEDITRSRKYYKLKVDIRNQAKTKARQIRKERREELLEQRRKNQKHFKYLECQFQLMYEALPPCRIQFYGL